MKIGDIKPASFFASRHGAKILTYGRAGLGKTPLLLTAGTDFLVLATEKGATSLAKAEQKAGLKMPTYEALTVKEIDDFFAWWHKSNEPKKFKGLCVDSGSEVAEIYLNENKKKINNKQRLYGMMSDWVYNIFCDLNNQKFKHLILNCKRKEYVSGSEEVVIDGKNEKELIFQSRPYFPGQDLHFKCEHLFDLILFLELKKSGDKLIPAFHTKNTDSYRARDRYCVLNEFEEPNYSKIIKKLGYPL